MARSEGLASVLDDCQSVVVSHRDDAIHFTHSTVQMYRYDGLGEWCDRGRKSIRVHVEIAPDFHENWFRPTVDDCRDRGHKGVRHCDHFIAGSDSSCSQGEFQGVVTAIDPYCILHTHERGQVFLEIAELRPANQVSLRETGVNCSVNLRLQVLIMRPWIDKGYSNIHFHYPPVGCRFGPLDMLLANLIAGALNQCPTT